LDREAFGFAALEQVEEQLPSVSIATGARLLQRRWDIDEIFLGASC
jgi:hypothetical protein